MPDGLSKRLAGMDWTRLQQELDERGYAVIPALLDNEQCEKLISAYEDEALYRKTIRMARYSFGEGEYKYFSSPLPDLLQTLREGLYPELAKAANRWKERLGRGMSYPEQLSRFLALCQEQGQLHPTPLILKYEAGGYNCLHQDLYGDVYFPFQTVIALNQTGSDYAGGEFMLVEQRPRAQSRGHVIRLEQGEALVFPTQYRPVQGSRGYYRTTLRHGVSTITEGTRYSLGVIFHDAK
ncbi:2OG-Fe(II) oxygenase [Paenibacillus radicis (ex Gao et al. 2016)]|uniref:Prolyl 4-hydroxylase n=1 Tax=Paenibacillus radicis (ex Gao et al. 2016) TaxID=1737354 RepID=A0A917HH86_9BACL|nr:2OG-Fe(II) oxygenase [Paenibacillus radicis (ex Gao et al. 2016)]GGG79188.1 prolyl 4-hydroxylase [Paenibacillus radicis (ex Gao et al. 2016)]